jgi:hypothetical protein
MLYLIGRKRQDAYMMKFASNHIPEVLFRAHLPDQRGWAQTAASLNPDFAKPVWRVFAELDQATATLSLQQRELAGKCLSYTYPTWLTTVAHHAVLRPSQERLHGCHTTVLL